MGRDLTRLRDSGGYSRSQSYETHSTEHQIGHTRCSQHRNGTNRFRHRSSRISRILQISRAVSRAARSQVDRLVRTSRLRENPEIASLRCTRSDYSLREQCVPGECFCIIAHSASFRFFRLLLHIFVRFGLHEVPALVMSGGFGGEMRPWS